MDNRVKSSIVEGMMGGGIAIEQTHINEYMAEVNDFLTNSLFKDLTCHRKRMSTEQAEYYVIADLMLDMAKPTDFGI